MAKSNTGILDVIKNAKAEDVDIGIDKKDRAKIADALAHLLADTYTLYLKTHNYHWNVTGPMFNSLHAMFEGQYTELATAVDDIAERIRAIGYPAPGSYKAFAQLSEVKESDELPDAMSMVKDLARSNEIVAKTAREVVRLAGDAGDDSSADLATQRMQTHEKTAWMLRATADKS